MVTRLALTVVDGLAAVFTVGRPTGAFVQPGKTVLAGLTNDVLALAVFDRASALIAYSIGGIGGIQDTSVRGHSGCRLRLKEPTPMAARAFQVFYSKCSFSNILLPQKTSQIFTVARVSRWQ